MGCGWGIEHSLLWQVDVSFGNDACRVLNGLADANLSIVRRSALGLLKHKPSEKIGVKNKRLTAACNTRSMEKVLTRQRLMVQLPCPLSRADGRFLAAVHFGILRGWWSALGYTGLCRIAVRLYRVSWCVAAMFCVFRR